MRHATSRQHSARSLAGITAAVLVASAGAAGAQTISIYGMPDFDQRRQGLANDGNSHCVPTASLNLMGYIANHGWTPMLDGPRNWQLQSNHQYVSGADFILGLNMLTTGTGGTGGQGWYDGLILWTNAHAPGLFTVSHHSVDFGFHVVHPSIMYSHLNQGSLVAFAYGRYKPYKFEPGMHFRNGGHAVTLTGITNPGSNTVTMRYRDPATDDGSLTMQSTFTTRTVTVSPASVAVSGGSLGMWEMTFNPPVGDTTRRCIDSYVVLNPIFTLTPSTPNILQVAKPFLIGGLPGPQAVQFTGPLQGSVAVAALMPDQLHALAVATSPAGDSALYWLDLETGEWGPLVPGIPSRAPVAVGRHGDTYLVVGTELRRYDFGDGRTSLISSQTPTGIPGALAYDDDTDEVIAVIPSTGHLLRYPHTLATAPQLHRLPTALPVLVGPLSVEPGPEGTPFDGQFFLHSQQRIYLIAPIVGSIGMQLVETIDFSSPGAPAPTDFCVTDIGSLLIARQGQIREYRKNAASGVWELFAGSPFAGQPAGETLCVSRSRTNLDPAMHSQPGWELIIDQVEGPETPDPCTADFDGDGDVGTDQDIEAFLACLGGNCCALCGSADFDRDGDTGTDADIEAFFRVLGGGPC